MTDIYYDTIYEIVTDYAKKYQSNPESMKSFFEKFESPVSVMQEFYRKMVATNEFKPIEDYEGKQQIWNQVINMNCTREKKIRIAKAIYCIEMILT